MEALCDGRLEDAGLNPELMELLRFAEELTTDPEGVSDDRIHNLRALGYSDEGIAEAVYVIGLFNFYNRVASAFQLIPDKR